MRLSDVLCPAKLLAALLLAAAPSHAVAAVATPSADAGTSDGARAAVEERLQRSATGVSAADAAGLGAQATGILFAIVDDRAAAPALRARAIDALGFIRVAAAHSFLENLIVRKLPSRDTADHLLLRRAAVALGWQSGPRVVEALAPLLDHDDAGVRLDAAVGLGLSRLRAAEKPLRARLARETSPDVRQQINAQLRTLAPTGDRAPEKDGQPGGR